MNTEPFISDYSSPTMDANPLFSQKRRQRKGNKDELFVFAELTNDFRTNSLVVLAIRAKTSKTIFKC
jgi:hypothetical protein